MKKYRKPSIEITEIFDVITVSAPTIDGGSTGFTPTQDEIPTPSVDGKNTSFNW